MCSIINDGQVTYGGITTASTSRLVDTSINSGQSLGTSNPIGASLGDFIVSGGSDQIWTNGLSQPNDWLDGDNWQGDPADENVPGAGATATFNSGNVPSAGLTLSNVPDGVDIIV